ncbi:regulatory protein TetR [Bifidobacterium lemurum]|uniref:Regulatory protein TetR n=2 Tax=Bifidobacterium lemurum TaxID=1603886 RepID=A0A261FVZ7_9BIFI|nr:regulatory protein TetR [Bifidobacterium lemurum]
MIRRAYVELLETRDRASVTVVDIAERADLSRNTFYAHYHDIDELTEEIQDDFLLRLRAYLDEAMEEEQFDDPLPLLNRIGEFIETNRAVNTVLIAQSDSSAFLDKLKNEFVARTMVNVDETLVADIEGTRRFLCFLAEGAVGMYRRYLMGELDVDMSELSRQLRDIYMAGIKLYQ